MSHEETTRVRPAPAPARWPHRRFRPTTRGGPRLPGGLLGMLVLAAAVELAVFCGRVRFLDIAPFGWTYSARAATEKAPGAEVLCLGDSLVKHGLSPRVIREVTGRRAYNLATPAATAPMTYMMFRRALGAGAKPSVVVFDLKPSLQIGGPEYSALGYAEVMTPGELFDLWRSNNFRGATTEMLVNALLPSVRCRREIQSSIASAFAGKTAPYHDFNVLSERNWTVNDGVNIATPRPDYAGGVTESEHAHLISRGFFPNRFNAEYVVRFLRLAEDRGVRTYLVLPPFVRALVDRRRQTGAEAKYEAYVRSIQDRFPALTVLDARETGYPHSVFIDPIHLDSRGTMALSADVAAFLRDDFDHAGRGGPPPKRWVRLPAYRARPIPADLEDVELSRARLGLPQAR